MENVLFFVKNLYVTRVVKAGLEAVNHLHCDSVAGLPEARALIEEKKNTYSLSVVEAPALDDDARAVIEYCRAQGLPPILLTNEYTDAVRKELTSRRILDYILKDEHFAENLVHTVRRVERNMSTKILVVDDSAVSREQVKGILEHQKLTVFTAADGNEALGRLEEHPDTALLLVDFNMPEMNGVELIRKARKRHPKSRLAIIGFSAVDNPSLSARLLKSGANDFIFKSFIEEELYLRVTQNLEMIEYIEDLRHLSHTDYLTQLSNRRYFYEAAEKALAKAAQDNVPVAVAMADIDQFKRVNDQYGHDAGDAALQHVAGILKKSIRPEDIVCRFGGEEFCVIAVGAGREAAGRMFENIRAEVAAGAIAVPGGETAVTISIGVAVGVEGSLDATISRADKFMYAVKESGRNRVLVG